MLTSASRAAVFLYTAPFFVALGSYVFLGERLRASQWGGLGLSFAGVALAIGVPQANVDAKVLLGDLLIVAGGALWATTTLIVKATALIKAPRRERPRLPGGALHPDSGLRSMDFRRASSPMFRGRCRCRCWPIRRSGWWADVPVVVRAGEDLFGQQIVGLHLHHAVVRRGGGVFHHARHADDRASASRRCW